MRPNRIDWLQTPHICKLVPLPDEMPASIPIVYSFPGATADCLDGFVDKFKAIVVVAYGSGNVNENMYLAIKKLIKTYGIKVVLVSNCKYGGVYAEYGGNGGKRRKKHVHLVKYVMATLIKNMLL